MSVRTKLAAFALILGIAFASAFALGGAVGPFGDDPAPAHRTPMPTTQDGGGH